MPPDQLLRQVRTVRRWARVHVTFDDAFRSVVSVIPQLLQLGVPVTIFVCSGYADRGGAALLVSELETDDPEDREELRTMSWDDLSALARDGVEVGSHTISHAHLTGLGDSDLACELEESKRRIEDELGCPCPLFAYPYGELDRRVRAAVRAVGYERAFALWSPRGDRFASPRVDLYRRDSLWRTLAKTAPFRSGPRPSLQYAARSAEKA
jgi:peptidoglycan/xylan/chitin deacetylase (PgdA/CDA1 family)